MVRSIRRYRCWFAVTVVLLGLAVPVRNDANAFLADDPPATPLVGSCSAAQIDACLYQPEESYPTRTLPAYTIDDDTRGGRQFGVLIRYPVGAPEPFPVIVFSHGGGPKPLGNFGNQEWGEALAGAGYVVVHLNHTLNDTDRDWACAHLAAGDPCDGETALTILRPGDAGAAIRAIFDVGATFPDLAGRVDLDRIAVAGHSFGSYTAMSIAGATIVPGPGSDVMSFADPTPVAFLALSPSGPGHFGFTEDSFSGIDRPMMVVSGSGDQTPGEQPRDRFRAYELLPPGDKALVWIDDPGSSHDTFNLVNPEQPEMLTWIASAGVAWFDATLRDRPEAWLWLASGNLATASGGIAAIDSK